jgi:hypothetical protein
MGHDGLQWGKLVLVATIGSQWVEVVLVARPVGRGVYECQRRQQVEATPALASRLGGNLDSITIWEVSNGNSHHSA